MDRIPTIYRNLELAKTFTDFEDVAFRVASMNLSLCLRVSVNQYASKLISSRNFTSEDVKKLEIEFKSLI